MYREWIVFKGRFCMMGNAARGCSLIGWMDGYASFLVMNGEHE